MRTTLTIIIAIALTLATFGMNAIAQGPVTVYGCVNNKGSQFRFVDNPWDCGNGENVVEMTFYADYFYKLSDTEFHLTSYERSSLNCSPYTTLDVSAIRILDGYTGINCDYGYFLRSFTQTSTGISASCYDSSNSYEPPTLQVDCRIQSK